MRQTGQLVGALEICDRLALAAAHFEHLGRRLEGERHRWAVVAVLALGKLVRRQDEPSSDGVVGLREDRAAFAVERLDHEPVGVPGKGLALVEDERGPGI